MDEHGSHAVVADLFAVEAQCGKNCLSRSLLNSQTNIATLFIVHPRHSSTFRQPYRERAAAAETFARGSEGAAVELDETQG